MTAPRSPWWDKGVHEDKRPFLTARARIRASVRQFFEAADFVEVECGALQVSPGNEAHLHAFATRWICPDGASVPLYLHTSPEFACKKLLAAGERRIFTLAPVYRNRERGALHAPEFTMLEWYRAGEAYDAVIEDSLGLARLAAKAAGGNVLRFRGRNCDPFAAPERLSVAEAFKRCAGIDLACSLDKKGTPEPQALARAAVHAGIKVAPDDTWSDIFSRVLVERIEPNLGLTRPTILDRYPRAEAALARATADDPRFAERFELYCCGVELANGFGELTDAQEQRRRFEVEMDEKARIHGERYPIDEELLAALAHMPESSGVALGFDRLVMLATGADRIDRVMWTPPPDERDGDS
ncbi:MAG TPA: EF-P lysine aminoacylase EpmA [Micropepsaceae bacterium]|nr:EF-P lysine aminoacylase EpmA [Micropepsaceae bacterium]